MANEPSYKNRRLPWQKIRALRKRLRGSPILGVLEGRQFFGEVFTEEPSIRECMRSCIRNDLPPVRQKIRQIMFVDVDFFIMLLAEERLSAGDIMAGILSGDKTTFTLKSFQLRFPDETKSRSVDIVFRFVEVVGVHPFCTADETGKPF